MQLHKFLLTVAFLVFVMLLNGCTLWSEEEDLVKMSPLPSVKNQFNPSISWRSSVGRGIGNFYSNLHPSFFNGVVYVADRKGIVKAISVDKGQEVWSTNLAEKKGSCSRRIPALLSGGVTVSGDQVYVGSEKAQVYSLNVKDGSILWKSRVAGEALSCPVISEGMVLVHTSNGQLQALNEVNGMEEWIVDLNVPSLSLRGESSPATISGTAILGNDNGSVIAVLVDNGRIIWQQSISQGNGINAIGRLSDVDATPVIVDDVVYALAYNGNLAALSLRNGQIIWKRRVGSVKDFIVHENRIYLVDQNDVLLALRTERGSTLWSQTKLLHRLLTPPALYNGSLVVGDSEGYMHWVDLKTGHFVAQKKVNGSGFLSKPVVGDGKLLIQAKDGKLYAITR